MAISETQKAELEHWSIRVYQQLQADYPIAEIRAQFDRISDIDAEEVTWILETAKSLYLGYFDIHRDANRKEAKTVLVLGPALTLTVVVFVDAMGWSTAGFQNGRVIWVALLGLAIFGYGIWLWLNADLPGRRSDVREL